MIVGRGHLQRIVNLSEMFFERVKRRARHDELTASRSNSARLRFFGGGFFCDSTLLAIPLMPLRESAQGERNNKGNHVVAPPTPHRYPFFHKKSWNCYINNCLTEPPEF